ncbi:MAG: transcriptional regulator, Fur family transcriptional regulator, ferric uptake regulator [Candidatus Saccharibacteria bacterium]|nr:transcriptional regulator, Fur family transcriptional regulator, ferric uptake regulator [Candidatus Saccharibacteria bacterium]
MSTSVIEQALKQHHVSLTKPRKQIYEVLSHNEPLTMQELITSLPQIDKTTAYRTVALFESLGIVQRLQIGWKYKLELSNQYQDHHHHITCLQCGQTVALPEDEVIEERLLALAAVQGFEPKDHQLEVRGLCPACRQSA